MSKSSLYLPLNLCLIESDHREDGLIIAIIEAIQDELRIRVQYTKASKLDLSFFDFAAVSQNLSVILNFSEMKISVNHTRRLLCTSS